MEAAHSTETLPEERTPQAAPKNSSNDTVLKLARCLICKFVFPDVNKLFNHYKTKHQNECTCGTCSNPNNNGTSHNLLTKVEVRSRDPDEKIVLYRCQSCKDVFTTCCKCLEHCNTAHRLERPFECASCPKTFPEFKELYLHLRKHNCRAKVVCGFCKKVFTNAQTLNMHVNKHKKEQERQRNNNAVEEQNKRQDDKVQNEKDDADRNNGALEESGDKVDQRNNNCVGEKSMSQNENDDALRNNGELEESSDNIEDQRNNNSVGEQSKGQNDKVQNENSLLRNALLRNNRELEEERHDNRGQANVTEDGQSVEGQGKNGQRCSTIDQAKVVADGQYVEGQGKSSQNSLTTDKQGVVKKRRGRPPKNATASSKPKPRPNTIRTSNTKTSNTRKRTTEEPKKRRGRQPGRRGRPPKQSKPDEERPHQPDKSSEAQIPQTGGYCCVICTRDFRTQPAYDKHMVVYHHIRRNKRNCATVVREKPDDHSQESGSEKDHDSEEDHRKETGTEEDHESEEDHRLQTGTEEDRDSDEDYQNPHSASSDSLSSPSSSDSEWNSNVDPFATSKSPKHSAPPRKKSEDGQYSSSSSTVEYNTKEATAEEMVQERSPTPEKMVAERSLTAEEMVQERSPTAEEMVEERSLTPKKIVEERNPTPEKMVAEQSPIAEKTVEERTPVADASPLTSVKEKKGGKTRKRKKGRMNSPRKRAKKMRIVSDKEDDDDDDNALSPSLPDRVARNFPPSSCEERANSDESIAIAPEIPVLTPPQDLIEISDDEGADYGEPALLFPQGKSAVASTYATPQSGHNQHNNDHYASTSFTHSSPDTAVLVGNNVSSPKILISNVCSIPHCDNPANSPRFASSGSNPINITHPAPSSFNSTHQQRVDSSTLSSAIHSIPMQRVVPPAFSAPSSIPAQTLVSPTSLSASSTIPAQRVVSSSYSSTSSIPVQRVASPTYSATSSIPPPMQVDLSHGTPMCVRCWRYASTTNVCEFCGIIFTDVDIYTLHKLIHDRENPYKCTGCGKVFGSKYQFTSHIFRDPHP